MTQAAFENFVEEGINPRLSPLDKPLNSHNKACRYSLPFHSYKLQTASTVRDFSVFFAPPKNKDTAQLA